MKGIAGNWVGRISGTNIGYVFAEIKQEDHQLSGIARINDTMYGTAIYNFTGSLEGDNITLTMIPDNSVTNIKSQTILVNNQPVNVQVPGVRYGNVSIEATLQDDFTISGKWTSTIGTAGTLQLRNDDILRKEKEKISQHEIKNQAFVMMSISPDESELEDVLHAIKRATHKYGIECKRVDEILHSGKITDLILEYINVSKYLICDISKEKPNVYYELGYAHGTGKEVILIAKHGTTMHFDIKDYNTIFYKNMTELEDNLAKRLAAIIDQQ